MPITSPSLHDIISEAVLLDPVGGSHLRLRFQGPFEGRTVFWDATITTLNADQHDALPGRNYIEIGDMGADGIHLTVGLNVPCIDLPTIRKAMMMIRQYRHLHYGRHEFGNGKE